MKIKSTVWYWLAVASGAAGLIAGMGLEGSTQVTDTVWMDGFVAAMGLILAAILFARLGFAAEEREKAAKRCHKKPQRTVQPSGKRKAG